MLTVGGFPARLPEGGRPYGGGTAVVASALPILVDAVNSDGGANYLQAACFKGK